MSEKRIRVSDLRAVSEALGGTDVGLTDKEITEILDICGFRDEFTDETKGERLFKALSKRQSRDGNRRAILAFIRVAMNPERYVGESDKFERRLVRLNEELALCGLEVQGDGTLASSQGVETDWHGHSEEMSQARSEGLIRALWRGHVSLVWTYWVYGVLGSIILSIPGRIFEYSLSNIQEISTETAVFFFIYFLFVVGYMIFICVAIFRSAGNYKGPGVWAALARVAVVLRLALFVLELARAI